MADVELVFSNVDVALKQGDFSKAKSLLQSILNADPMNQQARFTQIQVLFRLNAHTELVPFIDDTIKLFPEVPDIWFHHGNLMIELGNYKAAVKSMVKARSKIQGKSPLIILICNALLEIGQPQVAWDLVPPSEDTDRYHIILVRAKALAALGAPIEARAHLMAASQQPNLVIADRFYLWQAAKNIGFADIELDFFLQFLKLKHTTVEDQLFLANIHLANKQLRPAERIINTLLAGDTTLYSSDEYVKALVLAARCANLRGDSNTAKKRLTEALFRDANSSEVLEMLVEHADETQLAQFNRQYIVKSDESLKSVSELTVEEQKKRLMACARIAEKNSQYQQAFDYFTQANDIEKTRIETTPKLDFTSGTRAALIDGFIAEFPSMPKNTASVTGDMSPIFIVGMPRTGTTLLERILGGLRGVKTTGENATLSQIVSQSKWDRKHRNAPAPIDRSAQEWQAMRNQFLSISNIEGKGYFTEKMPYNFRFVGYILGMFPEAPIIHIRRDPRDVCWSIYTRFFSGGHHYSADLQWILREFELSERLMDHFKFIAPDKILTVDYEALVLEPLIQARRVADFCRLPWDPNCLDFHRNTTSSYTSSELQVRKALNKSGIARWRNYETQLKKFLDEVEASEVSHFMYS